NFARTVSSFWRTIGFEEAQAGIEGRHNGADAPHGRENLVLQKFSSGSNFIPGADNEFVEPGGLHARTFRDFSSRMAKLAYMSAHRRGCLSQDGGNGSDLGLGVVLRGGCGGKHGPG